MNPGRDANWVRSGFGPRKRAFSEGTQRRSGRNARLLLYFARASLAARVRRSRAAPCTTASRSRTAPHSPLSHTSPRSRHVVARRFPRGRRPGARRATRGLAHGPRRHGRQARDGRGARPGRRRPGRAFPDQGRARGLALGRGARPPRLFRARRPQEGASPAPARAERSRSVAHRVVHKHPKISRLIDHRARFSARARAPVAPRTRHR